MYVPGPNAVDDPRIALQLLRTAGVGHLVGTDGRRLDSTLLPFVVDDGVTTLRAHVARANPQWRALDGAPALLIVPITDAYVSPSWYPSKAAEPRVVPTWNYEVVHVHGDVAVHHDADFLEGVVRELTDLHERRRAAVDAREPVWSVDDAPADFVQRQLRAIVGIELTVGRVEAKRKLSQNRTPEDHAGVVEGLSATGTARDAAVADAMRP